MNILLTGATGYIGKRLLPILVENNHKVYCCVRDPKRFIIPDKWKNQVQVLQVDLLDPTSLHQLPKEIDVAYYLVHSMATTTDYQNLEKQCAHNFRKALKKTAVNQVIYLSGIVNEKVLSKHLASRKAVEAELKRGSFSCTTLRAGIIIGSGSASFEIIRDLVEKLPVMVAPKWLHTKCQPIGIYDVISILSKTAGNPKTFNKDFDIGGPNILTYKEMLLTFAKIRNLKRHIFTVPVMTPRLSSYWLYFVTSTSYTLAVALVNSMKIEVVCRDQKINDVLQITPMSYTDSLKRAFSRVEEHSIVSSWKDAYSSSGNSSPISSHITVPTYGCFTDLRRRSFDNRKACIEKIWRIGGTTGWYHGNTLWKIRGFLDKLVGGVGLRRGRTHYHQINVGDALDFWRVLYAHKEEGRLLLYAEMKLPGEAWLEFKLENSKLVQTATFRPLGIAGRLYWYAVLPFHGYIFKGMINALTEEKMPEPLE